MAPGRRGHFSGKDGRVKIASSQRFGSGGASAVEERLEEEGPAAVKIPSLRNKFRRFTKKLEARRPAALNFKMWQMACELPISIHMRAAAIGGISALLVLPLVMWGAPIQTGGTESTAKPRYAMLADGPALPTGPAFLFPDAPAAPSLQVPDSGEAISPSSAGSFKMREDRGARAALLEDAQPARPLTSAVFVLMLIGATLSYLFSAHFLNLLSDVCSTLLAIEYEGRNGSE